MTHLLSTRDTMVCKLVCTRSRIAIILSVCNDNTGDKGAHRADIVLPGAAYTEKDSTYVNTEGRVQKTMAAAPMKGDAREDWVVVRAIAEILGVRLPYTTAEGVKERLVSMSPTFGGDDSLPQNTMGLGLIASGAF